MCLKEGPFDPTCSHRSLHGFRQRPTSLVEDMSLTADLLDELIHLNEVVVGPLCRIFNIRDRSEHSINTSNFGVELPARSTIPAKELPASWMFNNAKTTD